MRSFLLQPYPFSENASRKLAVCFGVGLFIAFFLAVFEPYGFDELPTATKWVHAAYFGAVTFFIASLFQIFLPKIFPRLFREEAWRSWKEILYLLLTTIFIGMGNYGLMILLYKENPGLTGFLRAQVITLQVGIFPIVFLVFLKQMIQYRRFAEEAKKATGEILPVEEMQPASGLAVSPKITLRGDNQKEELSVAPEDLFFVSSADNYVKVQYREGSGLKSLMLRSSLKKMEDQLSGHPQFFRCHRMYLVNLHLVADVSGNAQGLKLHLSGLEEAIPVSRSLTETVRDRLRQLSHSPQNA